MMDLWKPKPYTKFEVASFGLCVNIERNPQILGSTPSPGPCLPFLQRVILSWALANPSCMPNLKSQAPAVAPLVQGHAHFSYGCDFMMGLGKPKLCTKFEVASFSHCVHIEGEPPNFGELP